MLCAFVTAFSFSAYSLLLPAFLQEFRLLPIGALDIPDVIRLIRSAWAQANLPYIVSSTRIQTIMVW